MRATLAYPLVRIAVAILLLATAALKLHGLAADPVAPSGVFSTAEFQLAIVEFEAFLALWLLSGKFPLGSWLMTFAVFSCFTAYSINQGLIGQTSCGCFGQISVNPWHASILDIFVIGGLILARPDFKGWKERWHGDLRVAAGSIAKGLAGFLVVSGVLIGLAYYPGKHRTHYK